MQIKKFEARSMKEALQLVKMHLGPEAVILAAKDNRKAFGISGDKSVEVTAAVADETYRRMKVAQQKLRPQDLERFNDSTAKKQKEFIEKVFEQNVPTEKREMTATPYIDIFDEGAKRQNITFENVAVSSNATLAPTATVAAKVKQDSAVTHVQRVREAARLAWDAVRNNNELFADDSPAPILQNKKGETGSRDAEITELKNQILYLRNLLDNFQKVPQNFIQFHPGAQDGISFELSFMFEKLTKAGVSADNAVEILNKCKVSLPTEKMKNRSYVDAWVARYIMDHVVTADRKKWSRYQIFVGGPGQGKTSSLVKFASRLVINDRKKVAIVSTDNLKIGATDQLKIYSQILNVPFAIVKKHSDWKILDQKLQKIDHVLVDMPGLSLKDSQEMELLRQILPAEKGQVHYVQSVLAKDTDAIETLNRYKAFGVDDLIFTQLDQSLQHGLIYNLQKQFSLPLQAFGIGAQIPEDFEYATRERVVDLIFRLTKLRSGETQT